MVATSRQAGSVLIDNSTYFSSTVAIESHLVGEAATLYNLANFVECLVLYDLIKLAPTINWSPGECDDLLFGPSGPCQSLLFSEFSNTRLSEIYSFAIEAAITELTSPSLPTSALAGIVPYVMADFAKTRAILFDWHRTAKEQPMDFTPIYSGKVFATDSASRVFLATLPPAVNEDAAQEQQLAHYLLRTCVAIELSSDIPYHPHSFRADFVCERLRRARRRFGELSTLLMRHSEEFAKAVLSQSVPYVVQRSSVPLVLAVVLSGAARPDAILPLTLDLRDSPPARRYREWTSKLADAFENGTTEEQIEATNQLADGRRALETELTKLYGAKNRLKSTVNAISTVLDDVKIASNVEVKAHIGAKAVGSVVDYFRQYRHRRKVAILLSLVGDGMASDLNGHISRVFGKPLSSDALADFERLRAIDRARTIEFDDQSGSHEQ